MARDKRIILFGKDVHTLRHELLVRFGKRRVMGAPISENAFLGAGVAAAMAGLRPVVELYKVDFLGVAMDPVLNHTAKLEVFSGGKWREPVVVRIGCGGGYGDGGQHEQSLWGWLAHIPGLSVVVPSTPADADVLMLGALEHNGPVVFLMHTLLSESMLEFVGSGGRHTVHYDVPPAGRRGLMPRVRQPLPLGEAPLWRNGTDITLVSIDVGVHRCMEAANALQAEGVSAAVLDLRGVSPLDKTALCGIVARTGSLLVVD